MLEKGEEGEERGGKKRRDRTEEGEGGGGTLSCHEGTRVEWDWHPPAPLPLRVTS